MRTNNQVRVRTDEPSGFIGQRVSRIIRGNVMTHIITVNTGEDVSMKVLSFFQQGSRSMCILSATGVISSVTFHQTDTSGGKVAFEGRYDLLTFAGSFVHSETGGMRNLSGGMSVSLISPEGRVIGGRIDGQLVAASPVQILVGFLPEN
uniref:AT-hook motif nuclear-localized protein n=1 Tax=Solanum tuberosum TaxID=4113 RepID=M1BHE1_SOLTU